MCTKKNWWFSMGVAALLSTVLIGCVSSLPPSPPVIGMRPQLTPLPVSVLRIDPQSSQTWLHEVQSYFEAVESLSNSGTPR